MRFHNLPHDIIGNNVEHKRGSWRRILLLLLNDAVAFLWDLELLHDSHNIKRLGLVALANIISCYSNSKVQSQMSSLLITRHCKTLVSTWATIDFTHPRWPFFATKDFYCNHLSMSSSFDLCLFTKEVYGYKMRTKMVPSLISFFHNHTLKVWWFFHT